MLVITEMRSCDPHRGRQSTGLGGCGIITELLWLWKNVGQKDSVPEIVPREARPQRLQVAQV